MTTTALRIRRPFRAGLCILGCTALLLAGCARGDDPATSPSSSPSSTAHDGREGKGTDSKPKATASPRPPKSQGDAGKSSADQDLDSLIAPLTMPEGRQPPTYAEAKAEPPTSTFTGPIDVAAAQPIRTEPSDAGAVGSAVLYIGGLRDAVAMGDMSLIKLLSAPDCSTCVAMTNAIASGPAAIPGTQVVLAAWVLGDVFRDAAGRTWVTIGTESATASPAGADGTAASATDELAIWDIGLEYGADGWTIREMVVAMWA